MTSSAKVWNAKTGALLFELDPNNKNNGTYHAGFSSDGKQIISVSNKDFKAKIWDATNYNLIQTLQGYTKRVAFVKYSPDGKTMATFSGNDNVRIWNVNTGQLITSYENEVWYDDNCEFSSDGKKFKIVTEIPDDKGLSKKVFLIINAENGKWLGVFPKNSETDLYVFSPDLSKYTTVLKDSIILIKDLISNNVLQILRGNAKKSYYFTKFSPDAKLVLAASKDNSVEVWDTATGKLSNRLYGFPFKVIDANFSEKITVLGLENDSTVSVSDVVDGKKVGSIKLTKYPPHSGTFLPNGKKVIFEVNGVSEYNTGVSIP
jgi:WD40 repeat protein